jgi:hypothetical protein
MSENDCYETYQCVPADFDLLNAPPGDLDLFGIPHRDLFADPRLFEFWKTLISPPFFPQQARFNFHSFDFGIRPPSTLESSMNWSGGVISPPHPKRFILAVASWVVPAVSRPSAPALFTFEDAPKTLIWVGLDGHNGRLPKISLPQIGTFHRPDGPPDRQHYAWWYWWHHTHDPIAEILDFEVRPLDEIMAGLTVLVSKDVLLFIKNQRTGQFRSFLAKQQKIGDIEPLGSSAEWVVERPTEPTSPTGQLYPLAAYQSVNFKYCMALAADTDRPLAPGRLMTFADNGHMIKMREAFAAPYRTAYVSRADRRHDKDGSIGLTCTFHQPT